MIGSVDANIETFEHSYYGTVSGFRADEVIFERVGQNLIWEPHLVEEFGRHIRPGSVAIDCGANIGVHSLAMAASQPEIAEVLAFEPHPQIFPVLEKNVSGNDKIRALEQAVGASNGWLGAMKMDHWWNPGGATMKRLPRFAWPFSRKTNTSDYRFRLSLSILSGFAMSRSSKLMSRDRKWTLSMVRGAY